MPNVLVDLYLVEEVVVVEVVEVAVAVAVVVVVVVDVVVVVVGAPPTNHLSDILL